MAVTGVVKGLYQKPEPFSILPGTLSIGLTTVKFDLVYDYFGEFNQDTIADEASKFVGENSDSDLSDVKSTVQTFIDVTSKDYSQEKAQFPQAKWFTIRMSTPTELFTNKPRWHKDGRMYKSENIGDVNSKYAITLLGNSTRVLKESAIMRSIMAEEKTFKMPKDKKDSKAIRGAVIERGMITGKRMAGQPEIDVPPGGIIKFSWGQVDSPIHSEPDMSTNRVFMSVLYGSETEMRDMCRIRECDYRS